MSILRAGTLAAAVLAAVGCTTGGPTTTPTPTAAGSPTVAPPTTSTPTPSASSATMAPSSSPAASLDPALSDAGVIGQVTLTGDVSGERDGTYVVVGVDGDGSGCSNSFDGTEFTAVAFVDDAPNGEIWQFSVTVAASAVPSAQGSTADNSGRVAFNFASESGIGTLYVADASQDSGQVTIDATRTADALRFDFQGAPYAGAQIAGTMICGQL